MHIELNWGGLRGSSVDELQSDINDLISSSYRVIDCFETIRSFTYNINGGVGNLQGAVDDISARIQAESDRCTALEELKTQVTNFIDDVRRIDSEVSELVDASKEEFYEVNPWARPPEPEPEREWYEEAWDACCDFVGDVIDGACDLACDIGEWCYDHRRELLEIAIGAVALAGAVALTIATGGALAPVFIGVAASTVIGGGVAAYQYYNGNPDGASSLGEAIFSGCATGFMTGSVGALVGGFTGLSAFDSVGRIGKTAIGAGFGALGSGAGETIHALTDGDGISGEEARGIVISALVGGASGGLQEYATFGYEDGFSIAKSNAETLQTTTSRLRTEAIENMRAGIPNSIFNASETIKDVTAFTNALSRDAITREVIRDIAAPALETVTGMGIDHAIDNPFDAILLAPLGPISLPIMAFMP